MFLTFSYWIGSEHLPPDLALGERSKGLFNEKPCVQDRVHSTAGHMLQRCSRAQGIQPTAHSLFMAGVYILVENNIYSPPPLRKSIFFPPKTARFSRNIADDKIAEIVVLEKIDIDNFQIVFSHLQALFICIF
jgi:hypothetical protein